MKTPSEQNDEIRAQVEREMPRPPGGFESYAEEQCFRDAQDRRFFELCKRLGEEEPLRNTINRLTGAMEKAVNWLDLGAPGRAREELLEALKQ